MAKAALKSDIKLIMFVDTFKTFVVGARMKGILFENNEKLKIELAKINIFID